MCENKMKKPYASVEFWLVRKIQRILEMFPQLIFRVKFHLMIEKIML